MSEDGNTYGSSKASVFTNMLNHCIGEYMKEVKTSCPGTLVSFDPVTQLCQVQLGLKAELRNGTYESPTVLVEVPLQFWGGAGGTLECKMEAGVEGWVLFSQECIDSWVEQGGVAIKPELRRHDQNDACFMPGTRSKPGAIAGFTNNGIRLRNADGSSYVWIKDDGTVEIDGAALNVLCPTTFLADVDTMAALRNFLHDVGYLHRHSGVTAGNATSGPVTP